MGGGYLNYFQNFPRTRIPSSNAMAAPMGDPKHIFTIYWHAIRTPIFLRNLNKAFPVRKGARVCVIVEHLYFKSWTIDIIEFFLVRRPCHPVGNGRICNCGGSIQIFWNPIQIPCAGKKIFVHRTDPKITIGPHFAIVNAHFRMVIFENGTGRYDFCFKIKGGKACFQGQAQFAALHRNRGPKHAIKMPVSVFSSCRIKFVQRAALNIDPIEQLPPPIPNRAFAQSRTGVKQ